MRKIEGSLSNCAQRIYVVNPTLPLLGQKMRHASAVMKALVVSIALVFALPGQMNCPGLESLL
jgi:hypothetical protein